MQNTNIKKPSGWQGKPEMKALGKLFFVRLITDYGRIEGPGRSSELEAVDAWHEMCEMVERRRKKTPSQR